jgi:cytochrome c oxidase subunit 2
VGPSFQGIWGRKVEVHTGKQERSLVSDETYLRRSIMEPGADIVEGYPAVMPPFAGVLTEEEVKLIIDFFRTGGKVVVDDAYLRESIQAPSAAVAIESLPFKG